MAAEGQRLVVLAGTLIDGTGTDPLEKAAIVIEGGRFSQVGPQNKIKVDRKDGAVLDLSDRVVLPGLMDAHCHFYHMYRNYYEENTVAFVARAMQNAGMWLDMGVTTVREIGTRENLDLGLRDAIAAGLVRGPRIFASGTALAATGGGPVLDAPRRFVFEITGADEARRVVRKQLRAGVDFIKLFTTAGAPSGRPEMTYEEIQAATEEVHKAGKHVAAHAMCTEGILNCLRAGVNTIEHGNGVNEECVALMVKQGAYLVPTLSITYSMAYRGERWNTPQSVVEFARGELPGLMAGVRLAREAGVKIAAGTDPPRLDTVPMECAVLVEAGLTPMEAIVAATRRGAEIVGREEDFGTVQPGRRADLAGYGVNPLDDITVLQRAELVMKDGVVVKDGLGRLAASAA
ncbi:MAG: hypothetical protein A2V59_11985 [Armatimonadetes bacterium RBG_19FT_COMBO_69_19]|nr:MAG: hypothetical protein A2V59_11985 [Armatimonadetes bacterium RBG_19FT_COMBO_69_19]